MKPVLRKSRAVTVAIGAAIVAFAIVPTCAVAGQDPPTLTLDQSKGQTPPQQQQQQTSQFAPSTTPAQMLTTALSYYFNDDNIEKSLPMFRELRTRYGGTSEGATAAYYIGLYYHRQFYLQEYRKGQGRADTGLLEKASSELDTYLKLYAPKQNYQWAADARFERFLIYLRRGRYAAAQTELKKMTERDRTGKLTVGDPSIFIGRLIWSTRSTDLINYTFPSADAAQTAQRVLSDNPTASFEVIIGDLQNRLKTLAAEQRSKGKAAF